MKKPERSLFADIVLVGRIFVHEIKTCSLCDTAGETTRWSIFIKIMKWVTFSALLMLGSLWFCSMVLCRASNNAETATLDDGSLAAHQLPLAEVKDEPWLSKNGENTRPIIGILTQEVTPFILRKYPGSKFTSYMAASYVKFVEGAGGRVVPIWIGRERDYYVDIMNKINGVLMPGGATYFNQSRGYADAGAYIYDIAIEMNKNGTHMPLWGTCLGFELLVYLSNNRNDTRTTCTSSSQALPLEFKAEYEKSRLFRNASAEIISILKSYPVTANFHRYCYTEEILKQNNLNDIWNVLSLNHDWNGLEFISTIEHRIYPFYGVQFHPEKNLYEFLPNRNISHTEDAVKTSQYFADFFLFEARKNLQHFKNRSEEQSTLIYNYVPKYTGAVGSAFAQLYLFDGEARSAAAAVATYWKLFSFTLLSIGFLQLY